MRQHSCKPFVLISQETHLSSCQPFNCLHRHSFSCTATCRFKKTGAGPGAVAGVLQLGRDAAECRPGLLNKQRRCPFSSLNSHTALLSCYPLSQKDTIVIRGKAVKLIHILRWETATTFLGGLAMIFSSKGKFVLHCWGTELSGRLCCIPKSDLLMTLLAVSCML